MYSPTSEEWKQAHSQARFVILSVLVEAEENFVSVKEVIGEDGKPDLLLTMDKTKLESVGKPAIGQFLKKLQVYKSLGDFESADEMFSKHSKVTEQWLQWRDIVIDRKQPRKMKVQANTIIKGNLIPFKSSCFLGRPQKLKKSFTVDLKTFFSITRTIFSHSRSEQFW